MNTAIAISALVVVGLGLVSRRIETLPLSAPLFALAVGVAVGPLALGWLAAEDWPEARRILKEGARVTLAISVTGIAMRTPVADFRALLRPWAVLLVLGMAVMWVVSSALGLAALGLAPLVALALGAAVAPTDPVVASSIVTGSAAEEILPDGTRSVLSLESGANDGLGYLIVLIPVTFLLHPAGGWGLVLRDVLLVGVVLAAAFGALVGWGAAWALRRADGLGWIEKHSLLGMTVAMSLLALTGAKLMGSDGILAAFTAGMAFNLTVDRSEDFQEQEVQETISKLFALPVFVLFGAMLPMAGWQALGWGGPGFAGAVLLLRRPLALLACAPLLRGFRRRDTVFLGWFGPVGVAAIYYALHIAEQTGDDVVWQAGSLAVAASVVAHGVTSGPGLRAYRRASGDLGQPA